MNRTRGLALAVCALAATSARAFDVNYCQDSGGPSPANCSNQTWVNFCDQPDLSNPAWVDPCTVPQPPDGKTFPQMAQEAWQASHNTTTNEKVFEPKADNFIPSMPPAARPQLFLQKTSGATGWANQELIAQYNASIAPIQDASSYTRTGIFQLINGISTCEDYVYYSFWDVERWIDAINACKDDARCKVNVSMKNYTAKGQSAPPGIVRRRPQNLDGNYIYDPTDPDNHMTRLIAHKDIDQTEVDPFAADVDQLSNLPKNAFHAGTEYLFPPQFLANMIAAGVPDAQMMLNLLARGDNLRNIGGGVPTANGGYYLDSANKLHQGYYDEWDFHHAMNFTTQLTTAGESREYRRRNDSVTKAWNQLADDMKCLFANSNLFDQNLGGCGQQNTPNAMGKVNPGDEQIYEFDPMQSWQVMSAVAQLQMAQPPSLFGQIGFGSQLQPAQYSLSQLQALDITMGAQNIGSTAHVPGMLSPNAVTSSLLLGAMNLPPAMVQNLSAAQIESMAATETRLANILAGQQGLSLLGNQQSGPGGNFLGLLSGIGGIQGLGQIGKLNAVLGSGTNGGAVPLSLTVDAASSGGGGGCQTVGCVDLSTYVAQYNPTITPPGGTAYMIERMWSVNPPRWTTVTLDDVAFPILNCNITRPRVVGDVANAISTDSIDALFNNLTVDDSFHTEKMWVSACQLTNLILNEWYRLKRPNPVPSCLDMTSTACDWVPQDFVDRFVNNNVTYASAAKEIEYSYCKRWTGGGQIMDLATYTNNKIPTPPAGCPKVPSSLINGVPSTSRQSLQAMRTFLDQRRDNFECVLKTVPVKGPENFGKVKTDGNKLGNGDFGGGYSYTLGWHSCAFRKGYTYVPGSCDIKTNTATNDPDFGKICRLGGSMNASFKAFATMFSQEIDIIVADVNVLANENDDHQGVGWADLTIAGFTVFNAGDKDNPITLTGTATPLDKMDTKKPQFIEAPFQVGWITVTVKAGILFDYGAKLTLSSQVPGDSTCTPSDPVAWEANAVFQPQADLGVWVTADATLAGMFGVGIEVDLILVGLGLPLSADVKFEPNPDDGQAAIRFDAELDLTLTTLKGELDFYIIAFWAKVASFKIVGWDGFVSKFPIFRTRPVYIDLGPLTPGSIHSPEQTDGSEDI